MLIRDAQPLDMDRVRGLFTSYADSLGFDLDFQDFDQELAGLPGAYGPPRGCILLAVRAAAGGVEELTGCVALRPLETDICEMKRLYVLPAHRGTGLGRDLAHAIIARARALGYARMRLDTVDTMHAAMGLYRSLGFTPINAYCANPLAGARYFELDLVR